MRDVKYKVYLKCMGVKKRSRVVKRHSFDLGYVELEHDMEALKLKARERIATEMRETKGIVHLDLERVELGLPLVKGI